MSKPKQQPNPPPKCRRRHHLVDFLNFLFFHSGRRENFSFVPEVGGGGSYFHMINYPGVKRRNKIEMCCSRTPSNFDRLFVFFWLRHLICPRLGHAGLPKVLPHLRQFVAPCLVLLVIFCFFYYLLLLFSYLLYFVCVCVVIAC